MDLIYYKMTSKLQKNIIATITYFDVNDFPLTSFEIWKHLIKANSVVKNETEKNSWSLTEVLSALESEQIKNYVSQKNGFYFLAGREKLIEKRGKREVISVNKIKKLRKKTFWLRVIPFVRMICLTGKLSQKNGTDSSDLDVLVVLKNKHIWTGRFLITFFTQILGWRRYDKKQKNRICLNYYITDKNLKIPTQDLFSAQEYSFILPLFDSKNIFERFNRINQEWIKDYKPNYDFLDSKSNLTISDSKWTSFFRSFFEIFFNFEFIENFMRNFQKKKILNNPKTAKISALIITNDQHLVFLPEPHGPKIFSEYKKRFEALEVS